MTINFFTKCIGLPTTIASLIVHVQVNRMAHTWLLDASPMLLAVSS
jgi:hypothetical protein